MYGPCGTCSRLAVHQMPFVPAKATVDIGDVPHLLDHPERLCHLETLADARTEREQVGSAARRGLGQLGQRLSFVVEQLEPGAQRIEHRLALASMETRAGARHFDQHHGGGQP